MYGITFFTVLSIPQRIETFGCLIVSQPLKENNPDYTFVSIICYF